MELTLLLLSLAVGAQSWPQIPDQVTNSRRETAFSPIPLTLARSLPVVANTEASMGTLNVRRARSLPVVDETESSVGTLNVRHSRRQRQARRDIPGFVGFEVHEAQEKRGLPSVDESESVGTLHVPHFDKRDQTEKSEDEWLQDEDLDAPMHASRGLPVVEEPESMGTLNVRDDSPGFITIPIVHRERPGLIGRSVEMQLENRSDVAYYAQLNIGSPPQQVYAQLDTGSFELWINPDCTKLTGGDKTFCEAVGEYDPSRSKTAHRTGVSKKLNYGIGAAEIDYVKDDIALSDSVKLKQVQFGVASKTQDQFAGILGLGYGNGAVAKYDNFVDNLQKQGVTRTRAYGVALGSKDEGGGVISFGAADSAKYAGRLAALPILPTDKAPDGVPRFWVDMKSMGLTQAGDSRKSIKPKAQKFAGSSMPVFFDTGATLTLLPPALAAAIAAEFGASELDEHGFYAIDCAYMAREGSVDFEFEGVTIKVPYQEIIRHVMSSPPSCYLGIMPSKKYALLGDTFMRSAYAVFDQDSDTVFLAQYQNCGSNLKTISRPSDIQRMVGSCEAPKADKGEDKSKEDKEDKDKNHDSSKDVPSVSLVSKPASTSASQSAHSTKSSVTTASASATKSSVATTSASVTKASSVSSDSSSSAVTTQTLSDQAAPSLGLGEAKQKDQSDNEEEEKKEDGKSAVKGLGSEEDANAGTALSARLGLAIAVVAAMVML
jgi:hypothetical protein